MANVVGTVLRCGSHGGCKNLKEDEGRHPRDTAEGEMVSSSTPWLQERALRLNRDLNIKDKLSYSINLISNLGTFFQSAPCEVRIKLLGSMFPEKIEFDGKNYRTKSYNKMLDIIYQETKQLQGHKKKKSPKNTGDFGRVSKAGLEPARL